MWVINYILMFCLLFQGYPRVGPGTAAPHAGGGSTPTVNLTCYFGVTGFTHTISGINDVGSNAIFVAVTSFNPNSSGINGSVSVTHSADSSTATPVVPFSDTNSPSSQFFYWVSPATSSSDSIVINGTSPGLYDTTCVYLISGVTGTYAGVSNNNNDASTGCTTSSCQTGAVTPSGSNVVVMACHGNYTSSGAPTVNSSFTGLQYNVGASGSAYAEACAYLIQTTGSTVNPTFSWNGSASSPTGIITAVK